MKGDLRLEENSISEKKQHKKFSKVLITTTVLALLSFFSFTLFPDIFGIETAEATLKSQIQSNNQAKLEKMADDAGKNIIKTAREIGFVFLAITVISMAYSVWFKKTAEGLADMKGRLLMVVLAVVFLFFTESILGTIFGLLGYKFN